jgi:hypothetical protein
LSAVTTPHLSPAPAGEDDTVELHVRNVPRPVWLRARQAALASRLRFGRYVIKLLENAGPLPPSVPTGPSRPTQDSVATSSSNSPGDHSPTTAPDAISGAFVPECPPIGGTSVSCS